MIYRGMYYFQETIEPEPFNGETDYISLLDLTAMYNYYEKQNFPEISTEGVNRSLEEMIFSPELAKLQISKIDSELLDVAINLKSGPIPGFDLNVLENTASSIVPSPIEKKRKKVDVATPISTIKRIRQEDSQHRRIMNSYFVIVGTRDNPIYEVDMMKERDEKYLYQFIIHSALDLAEESSWNTTSNYLKIVDKYNEWLVSSYLTANGMKFMLLHDARNEEGIKSFFSEVHELYYKFSLNPFYNYNSRIISSQFDFKVKGLAKKYL